MTNREETTRRPLLGAGERLSAEGLERASGGGPKYHPFTAEESYSLLRPMAQSLLVGIDEMDSRLTGPHVVIEATLRPNYLAASYLPDSLFSARQLYVVGTRNSKATHRTRTRETPDQPTKTLLVAGEPADLQHVAREVVEGPNAHPVDWEQLRKFEFLNLPQTERIVQGRPRHTPPGEIVTWEAVLSTIGRTARQRAEWGDLVFGKFVDWIDSIGGYVDTDYRRHASGLTFVPVALPAELVELAAQFNLLRGIRPMPSIRPIPISVTRAAASQQRKRETPSTGAAVTIFDGGVDSKNSALSPYTTVVDLSPEPPTADILDHGTLVTSATIYGNLTLGRSAHPRCTVDHYRVLPAPSNQNFDDALYWILDQIRATVEAHRPPIVNLSIGPDEVVDEYDEPNRWSAELDELALRHNILFVCAAGNNGQEDDQLGFNRIQVPGDMANGIAVGACNHPDSSAPLVRAPYSAVGPGRQGQRIQPTLVAFGGDSPAEPFRGFGCQGRISEAEGTSFAAPLVAHGLAELWHLLGTDRQDAALLRTFAVHFADRKKRGHKEIELGHGRAQTGYDSAFECAENTCTVLFEVDLRRSDMIGLRFPFPRTLDPATRIEMTWTLGFFSPIDPSDAADYTQVGVEATFRPHERIFSLNDATTKKKIRHVNLDTDRDLAQQLVSSGAAMLSEHPVAHPRWRRKPSEIRLRDAGKWETLMRGRVSKEALHFQGPRLDLNYLQRRAGRLMADTDRDLSAFMLLTMSAPIGVSLYDNVVAEYPVLTPVTTRALVRAS